MSKRNDYERLAQITSTAMDVAQSHMQTVLAEEKAARAQIATLQASRHQQSPAGTPAQHVAADVKWQIWIDHRREELNFELAKILVKKDVARAQLKRAFGKDQTVQALLKKQRLDRILHARRHVS